MKALKTTIKWIIAIVVICLAAYFLASFNGLSVSRNIASVNGSKLTQAEYKYYLDEKSDKTIVSFEYPESFEEGKNERYYPIPTDENQKRYDAYLEKARALENVFFLGRLGDYKYYNMDETVRRALSFFEKEVKNGK